MRKILKFTGVLLLVFSVLTVSLVLYGQKKIPDRIILTYGTDINANPVFRFSPESGSDSGEENSYSVKVSLLNLIPIKTSQVTMTKRHYVIAGGDIFGLKIYSDGVIIVGTGAVETEDGQSSPAEEAGIRKGDIILEIDGKKVSGSDEVSSIFQNCEGREMTIKLHRSGSEFTTSIKPVFSSCDRIYKSGMWIRDSAAGIGTITYIDPSTGMYGSLGHAICDCDTQEVIPISNGEAVSAVITGCYKGTKGKAGELCGVFSPKHFGSILINGESGAYGEADNITFPYELIPVASRNEIRPGKAQIISTVSGTEKKSYNIEITKINYSDDSGKDMSIKVTDSDLIEKTGGIVQGMSGSPIIQNGMLVGAVTHVFINDSLRGYAIFADSMLEISDNLYNSVMKIQDAA